MKTIEYTAPFFLAERASLRMSMFFFGVSSFWIDETSASWMVAWMVVKLAVLVSIKDYSTELQIS